MTRRARAYEARVRARRFRAGLAPDDDPAPGEDGDPAAGDSASEIGRVEDARAETAGTGPAGSRTARTEDGGRSPTLPAGASPLFAGSVQVLDGEPFTVRTVTGAAAAKTYVCPRCLQPIPPRFPHLVVWPVHARLDGSEGLSVRRHWHRHCWASQVRTTGSGRPR